MLDSYQCDFGDIPSLSDSDTSLEEQVQYNPASEIDNPSIPCTLFVVNSSDGYNFACNGIRILGNDKYGVYNLSCYINDLCLFENEKIEELLDEIGIKKDVDYSKDKSSLRYSHIQLLFYPSPKGLYEEHALMKCIAARAPSLASGFCSLFMQPIHQYRLKDETTQLIFSILDTKNKNGVINNLRTDFSDFDQYDVESVFMNWDACTLPVDLKDDAIVLSENAVEFRQKALNRVCTKQMGADNSIEFVKQELEKISNQFNQYIFPYINGNPSTICNIAVNYLKESPPGEMKVSVLAKRALERLQGPNRPSVFEVGEAVILLGQEFAGSNNVPLVRPLGLFGTHVHGGNDRGSQCYLYAARGALFDAALDDGLFVIPMGLCNGAGSVGVGINSFIPCFDPLDLAEYALSRLRNSSPNKLSPRYNNFYGTFEHIEGSKWISKGRVAVSGREVKITEIPIGVWGQEYNLFLLALQRSGLIEGLVTTGSNDHSIHVMQLTDEGAAKVETEGAEGFFRLAREIDCRQLCLLEDDGSVVHFVSPEAAMDAFLEKRLGSMRAMQAERIAEAEKRIERARGLEKLRGLLRDGVLKPFGVSKEVLREELERNGIDMELESVTLAELADDGGEEIRKAEEALAEASVPIEKKYEAALKRFKSAYLSFRFEQAKEANDNKAFLSRCVLTVV